MRLIRLTLKNFRCYRHPITIDLTDLTALIGRNDVGKSSVLEALAIFFEQQKADVDDAAKDGDPKQMIIGCEFGALPSSLILDATSRTSLKDEYLLNSRGNLEVIKIFNGVLKTPTPKVFIRAVHPSVFNANDLLALKIGDLRTRAKTVGVEMAGVNQKISADLRAAIRRTVGDLRLLEQDIEVETQAGAKELYAKIKESFPAYFLFRSDRASTDQDSEAQDPMKVAVRLAIEQQKVALDKIAVQVHQQVDELVQQTLAKISAMSPEVAGELAPQISDPKWDSIFKIALTGDSQIPLNKRGSGVRRLVLLGFLQAQAESKRLVSPDAGIIYAIEEPETSQHPDKQRALLQVLQEISEEAGFQVILTTHTPMLARLLPESTLRYIERDATGCVIYEGGDETMRRVAKALGVLPDHDVQIFVGVEGKHDENFLREVSALLAASEPGIGDLSSFEQQGRLIFIPVGGSNIGVWVSRLHNLNRPEFHIFDRDAPLGEPPHYEKEADEINQRANCTAVHTSFREMEDYLHPDAIRQARPEVALGRIGPSDDVPARAAHMIHSASDSTIIWDDLDSEKRDKKVSRAKTWLNKDAAALMTVEMLSQSDPHGDLRRWLKEITDIANR
jgi:putative ATP-dependent endonuclease of the OLD family